MFARQTFTAFKAPRGARGIAIKPNELPPVLRRAMLYGEYWLVRWLALEFHGCPHDQETSSMQS